MMEQLFTARDEETGDGKNRRERKARWRLLVFTLGKTEIDLGERNGRQRMAGSQARASSDAFASRTSFVSNPSGNQP